MRDNGRMKGFGYVEFENRDDLLKALGMHHQVQNLFYLLILGCVRVSSGFPRSQNPEETACKLLR